MKFVLPKCLSLLPCRDVEVDPATRRPTIVDVHQELVVPSFPSFLPRLTVWTELFDGLGEMDVRLVIDRGPDAVAEAMRIGDIRVRTTFSRPRQARTVLFVFHRLPLVGGGDLLFRLACGGTAIMMREVPVRTGSAANN